MPTKPNYGTNVTVNVTDQSTNTTKAVMLKIEKEQEKENPCKGCFFYDENENESLHSPCSLDFEQYRLLGSCLNCIFVKESDNQ